MGGGPKVMQCGFVVFFRSPGGLEATKGPHSAARAYPHTAQTAQARAARATRQDRRRPTGNMKQWRAVGEGERTQHQ